MMILIPTEHLPDGRTTTKLSPTELTLKERHLIMEGNLGYCEAHQNLYQRGAMPSCPLPLVCCKCGEPTCQARPKITDFPPCKEW